MGLPFVPVAPEPAPDADPGPLPASCALLVGAEARNGMPVAGFEEWLRDAAPGARIVYHRGDIACARAGVAGIGGGRTPVAERVDRLAEAAWRAAEAGACDLVQRRMGPGDFAYLAIRRRPAGRAGGRP